MRLKVDLLQRNWQLLVSYPGKLAIETDRWHNIDQDDRKCNVCQLNEVGDEFHYLFKCQHFNDIREGLLPQIIFGLVIPSPLKQIMNEVDERKLINLAKFPKYVLDCKNSPG